MFWAFEDLTDASELGDADAALGRITAWLHDAVYDPSAVVGANESASAEDAAFDDATLFLLCPKPDDALARRCRSRY